MDAFNFTFNLICVLLQPVSVNELFAVSLPLASLLTFTDLLGHARRLLAQHAHDVTQHSVGAVTETGASRKRMRVGESQNKTKLRIYTDIYHVCYMCGVIDGRFHVVDECELMFAKSSKMRRNRLKPLQ